MPAPDGFLFVPDFLDEAEQVALLARIAELEFVHDSFRGQRLKRAYAHFGVAYRTTSRQLDPAPPVPDWLLAVAARAVPDIVFGQCIVTRYPPGAGIGWHTDAPGFGDCILGLSLGGSGRFQLRPKGGDEPTHEVEALPGSMYLMRGPARWDFQHQVLPVRTARWSLTFRQIPAHSPDSRST